MIHASPDRSSKPAESAKPAGPTKPAQSEGFALPVVIILSLVAAALAASLLAQADHSVRASRELLERRRAFYAVDGMSRIVIREVQNFMIENPDPSTEDLQDLENVPHPGVDGYDVEQFEVASDGNAFDGPIPNGAFEGMNAHQKPILIRMLGRKEGDVTAARVDLRVTLGQISMFQFFVFGDGYTDAFPGANMIVNPGRIHANGDLCIGSTASFQIEHATSAGRILSSDSRCRRTQGSGTDLWDGSRYVRMNSSNSSGCTDCGGTGLRWQPYALTTWKGFVKDSAHGVPRLRLPITGTPQVQAGRNATGSLQINSTTTRLLVDPVLEGESPDILEQKYAWKADLRIINGVWYKNDGTWPGQPLWSDHPGAYATRNEEGVEGSAALAVGQGDLATRYAWSTVPKLYSYYEYDATLNQLATHHSGVISYGSLVRSSGSWMPGYWVTGAGGRTFTDVDGRSKLDHCNVCSSHTGCSNARAFVASSTGLCQYSTGGSSYAYLYDTQYLQATRSGFLDQRVRSTTTSKGPILPINLDIAAFTTAMLNTTPGELGSWFDGGASFNGIVYITSTWPGSMNGVPDAAATLWPDQGSLSDTTQILSYSVPMAQRALPYNLCSDSLGYISGSRRIPLSGPPSDGIASNGFEPNFTVPSCDASSSVTSRPNAVRIINAATLSSTTFPGGLSVVSNLPVYVTGNLNTSSSTSSATATPWVPFMIGADAVTLLSDGWDDRNSAWDNSVAYSSRNATSSTYNVQILGGIVETVDSSHYSGGIENYPRFLENWRSRTATITGSFVVGFASVYQHQLWRYGSPIYDAPTRSWSFDPHLKVLLNQPPGAPLFSIHSVSRLNRL